MKINIEKLIRGSKQVKVEGKCNTEKRKEMLEEAISYFQQNSNPKREEYFGIKNYASFGDQRCDCEPYYGPKHGCIVFRIDYIREEDVKIDDEGIYVLLTSLQNPDKDIYRIVSDFLSLEQKYNTAKNELEELEEFIHEQKKITTP